MPESASMPLKRNASTRKRLIRHSDSSCRRPAWHRYRA